MTSRERYLRRKKKREDRIQEVSNYCTDINRIFSFSKVMTYADKCCKGIGYKKSTQDFKIHMFTHIACTCRSIKDNIYKVGNTYHFQINERGKILPRRATGACAKHQRDITLEVKRCRQIAMLPYTQD